MLPRLFRSLRLPRDCTDAHASHPCVHAPMLPGRSEACTAAPTPYEWRRICKCSIDLHHICKTNRFISWLASSYDHRVRGRLKGHQRTACSPLLMGWGWGWRGEGKTSVSRFLPWSWRQDTSVSTRTYHAALSSTSTTHTDWTYVIGGKIANHQWAPEIDQHTYIHTYRYIY